MFGYVTIAADTLPKESQERYRAYYCGLCRTLRQRYGNLGRMTLSYDLTFLWIVLSSLYEPMETDGSERCALHPFKPHAYVGNELSDYCADMNVALSYHKCRDDWQDDRSVASFLSMKALEKPYRQIQARYPEKCAAMEQCLQRISQTEKAGAPEPDVLANQTAKMLGCLYRCREDEWADTLEHMGEALGRFIYLMDAYDDLPKDQKRGRYNPLTEAAEQEDYEDFCKESLTMLIAECTQAFEVLPLVQDVEILRNILYAGCWSRYRIKQQKRDKDKPAVTNP
ncbi:MAG: DUF5685 family protein [Eubacteriales bacterium]|nr:DUF5685 family protein [Eubacteriales bacterium]